MMSPGALGGAPRHRVRLSFDAQVVDDAGLRRCMYVLPDDAPSIAELVGNRATFTLYAPASRTSHHTHLASFPAHLPLDSCADCCLCECVAARCLRRPHVRYIARPFQAAPEVGAPLHPSCAVLCTQQASKVQSGASLPPLCASRGRLWPEQRGGMAHSTLTAADGPARR
jgi:hypothetical protein